MNMNRGNNLLDIDNLIAAYDNLQIGTVSKLNHNDVLFNDSTTMKIDSLAFNSKNDRFTNESFLILGTSNEVVKDTTSFEWFLGKEQSNVKFNIFDYSNVVVESNDTKLIHFFTIHDKANFIFACTGNYNYLLNKPTLSNILHTDGYSVVIHSSKYSNLVDFVDSNECLTNLGLDPTIAKLNYDLDSTQVHIQRLMTSNLKIQKSSTGYAMLNPYQPTKSFVTTTNKNEFDFPRPYEQDSFIHVQNNLDLQSDDLDEKSSITIGILSSNSSYLSTYIEASSVDYNLLIASNINTMKSNLSLYLSSSSNLSDLPDSNEALSNLGLDKFNQINFDNDSNTIESGPFSIQFGSSIGDGVFFNFLSNDYDVWRGENLNNTICVTSNEGGTTWHTIPQDNDEVVNISFTRATSNIPGTVKIDRNLTSNIDTVPLYVVYKEQVIQMNSHLNTILPEVSFSQFLSNNARVDPDSNLLHPSSNLFELFEIMKSNDDIDNRIRRQKVYNNLKLHPIAYLRNSNDFTEHLNNIDSYITGESNDITKIDYSDVR